MTTDPTSAAAAWSADLDLDAAIDQLVARDEVELPPYPAVALRIERLVGGGDFGLDELARLVASDQALAADCLRCANSATFVRGEPVSTLPGAVARIGAGELSRIAFASALGARALGAGPLSVLRRRVWHDGVAAAVLARELARARGLKPDEAFACGLLHDFGKVLAIECLERIARGARHPRPMPARFWEAVVDAHHLRLGTLLARRWSLPRVLADAITLHHEIGTAGAEQPALLAVVSLCDRLVRLLDERSSVGEADVAAVQTLSEADTEALIRGIEVVPGFVAAFERDTPPSSASLLEPLAPPPYRAPPRAVRVRVQGSEFVVTGFAKDQLVLRGPHPLPEGALLEVTVLEAPSVTFHARVMVCFDAPGGTGVVLMPFALGGPALRRWQGMTALAEG